MINPLQFYTIRGRPLGILLAGLPMMAQAVGHLRMQRADFVPYAELVVGLLFFHAAFLTLLKRWAISIIIGVAFFAVSIYSSTAVFFRSSDVSIVHPVLWWSSSLLGIAGLLFNRRWFDERIVRFTDS